MLGFAKLTSKKYVMTNYFAIIEDFLGGPNLSFLLIMGTRLTVYVVVGTDIVEANTNGGGSMMSITKKNNDPCV